MRIKLSDKNAIFPMMLLLFLAVCGTSQAGTYGSLTYAINGEEVTITRCDEYASGTLTIPGSLEGKPVTAIDAWAFSGCWLLTGIAFPSSLASIGDGVFNECRALKSVTLPSGISSIGDLAFSHCNSLVSIHVMGGGSHYSSVDGILFNVDKTQLIIYPTAKSGIYSVPPEVTSINHYAFSGCHSVTGIVLPVSLTSIGVGTFENCDSLASIALPAGITSIGVGAFVNCDSLASIALPAGITSIGERAFENCSSLTNITLPAGVNTIGLFMFSGCHSLTNVVLSAGLTSIGVGAFGDCRSLTSIALPANVTSIGDRAFSGCRSLTNVVLPAGLTSIEGYTFFECTALTSITFPAGLTSIGFRAFYRCYLLASVTLPSEITSIGPHAFYECTALTSITFPAGITSIETSAFYGCEKLTTAIFLGDAPTAFGNSVFSGTAENFTIHYLSENAGFTSFEWIGRATSWFMDNGLDLDIDLGQDVNGDGVTLLMAYALNLDPSLDLSGSLPKAEMDGNSMSITYYAFSPHITYTVETSTNLQSWTTSGLSISMIMLDQGYRFSATVDLAEPSRFLRLKVERES